MTFVANVTDVNDKIYDAARAQGRPSTELAVEMTANYIADTDALGLGRPDREPLASQTMDAIVSYIRDLIDSGHAYESGGDVFFRVRSDTGYGSLSHRRVEELDQGEGVEGCRAQGGSARLCPVEGAQARRGRLVVLAVGRRPPRLAHRVLGDGRGGARRGL